MTPRLRHISEWVECLHANIPPTRKCDVAGVSFNPLGVFLMTLASLAILRIRNPQVLSRDVTPVSRRDSLSRLKSWGVNDATGGVMKCVGVTDGGVA